MDNWKIQLVVAAAAFYALAQTCQGSSSGVGEETATPKDWQDELVEMGLLGSVASLMKRAKAQRFYGLMGKRSGVKQPIKIKARNNGKTFVGLMGRSVSRGEPLSRVDPAAKTAASLSEEQKPDWQEEERAPVPYFWS